MRSPGKSSGTTSTALPKMPGRSSRIPGRISKRKTAPERRKLPLPSPGLRKIPGRSSQIPERMTRIKTAPERRELPAPSPGLMKMPRRSPRVPERMIRKRMTRKRIRTAPETGKLPPSSPKSTKNRSPVKPFPAQLTARGGRPLCSSPGKISAGYRRILC